LWHQTDCVAQTAKRDRAHIAAIERQLSCRWLVEARNEFEQRTLSAPTLANHRDPFADTGGELHVVQHRSARAIFKADTSAAESPRHPQRRHDTARLVDHVGRFLDFYETPQAGARLV